MVEMWTRLDRWWRYCTMLQSVVAPHNCADLIEVVKGRDFLGLICEAGDISLSAAGHGGSDLTCSTLKKGFAKKGFLV